MGFTNKGVTNMLKMQTYYFLLDEIDGFLDCMGYSEDNASNGRYTLEEFTNAIMFNLNQDRTEVTPYNASSRSVMLDIMHDRAKRDPFTTSIFLRAELNEVIELLSKTEYDLLKDGDNITEERLKEVLSYLVCVAGYQLMEEALRTLFGRKEDQHLYHDGINITHIATILKPDLKARLKGL